MRLSSAVAERLLENFVSQEALAGDLSEQRSAGRSDIWYLKQVLCAVYVEGFAYVREHKLLAARAVLVGFVLYIGWISAFSYSEWWMTLVRSSERTSDPAFWAVIVLGYGAIAWIVNSFHRLPMLVVFLLVMLLAGVLGDLGLWPEWLPQLGSPLSFWGLIQIVSFSLSAALHFMWHRRTSLSRTRGRMAG